MWLEFKTPGLEALGRWCKVEAAEHTGSLWGGMFRAPQGSPSAGGQVIRPAGGQALCCPGCLQHRWQAFHSPSLEGFGPWCKVGAAEQTGGLPGPPNPGGQIL